MSFLKRLFGTTDALDDARARAGDEPVAEAAQPAAHAAPGFGAPEVTQTDDEVVLKMNAPGLDPESVQTEVEGSALVVKARGTSDTGTAINLNERLNLKGADLSQADVSYQDGQIVVRLPKAALKPQSS
ncbi:MAG TPA: Hsp20/alpha crystallin family protein [Gaiellaceae bacterium]